MSNAGSLEVRKCATDECINLHHYLTHRANECVSLVQTQLEPASSTPKRKAATARLCAALEQMQLANLEMLSALADVEDAV